MHIMVDISDDTQIVRRHAEVTGVVRRRRWSDEEKGRIVAEAIAPGAVIADVARQHDLAMDGLAALVKEQLKGDPFSGVIFCFRSKRADRVRKPSERII